MATPTDDTNNSCHMKAVELVEHSFEDNHLPVSHSFTQVFQRTSKKFAHLWDFENARKLAIYAP